LALFLYMRFSEEILALIRTNVLGCVENTQQYFSRVEYDSRRIIHPNSTLFIAMDSDYRNGSDYILSAYNKGVRHFLVNEHVVLKPEIANNSNCYFVKDTIDYLYELAAIYRSKYKGEVIAITGSVAKTIIKETLTIGLRKNGYCVDRSPRSYNSIIGVPLSILSMDISSNYWIIEAGVSKSGEMDRLRKLINPDYGCLTKITTEHDNGFDSINQKQKEKESLFKFSKWWVTGENDIELSYKEYNLHLVNLILEKLNCSVAIHSYPAISTRWKIKRGIRFGELLIDQFGSDTKSLDVAMGYLMSKSSINKHVIIGPLRADETIQEKELLLQWSQLSSFTFSCVGWSDKTESDNINHFNKPDDLLVALNDIDLEKTDILIKAELNYFNDVTRYLDSNIHNAYVNIDLDLVKNNLKILKSNLPIKSELMAMLKAESYGAGSEEIGMFLQEEGIHWFGVAFLSEAIALRKRGLDQNILVLNIDSDFDLAKKYDLDIVLYSNHQLQYLINEFGLEGLRLHIKVDTGMNRLGFDLEELTDLKQTLTLNKANVVGIMSHLHSSDNLEHTDLVQRQINLFDLACELFPDVNRHLYNSSAILNYSSYNRFEISRAGIGMFGIDPACKHKELEIAINVTAKVIQIKEIKAGQFVGYGIEPIKHNMKLAILNIGYADGVNRKLGKGNWKVFGCPTVGSICMDFMFIDITHLDKLSIGQELLFFNKEYDIYRMSEILETIPYEIMTSFTGRLNKVYIQE